MLARYEAIQCVGIYVKRGSECAMPWKVGLEIGFMRTIGIGSFETGVDASIVAAKISAIIGKQVRTLRTAEPVPDATARTSSLGP